MNDSNMGLNAVDPEIVKIYQTCFSELIGFVARITVDRSVAEEIAQEAGLRLMQSSLEYEIDNARAFLFFAAANLARDHLRHKKIASAAVDGVSDLMEMQAPSTERVVTAVQELQRLKLAINTLPKQARAVFEMVRVQGMSHKEVSEQLDISPKTVENHIARALTLLNDELQKERRKHAH